jgi:hypothetical protein
MFFFTRKIGYNLLRRGVIARFERPPKRKSMSSTIGALHKNGSTPQLQKKSLQEIATFV